MLLTAIVLMVSITQTTPSEYPKFDTATATPLVLSVSASNGDYLPQFDECKKPDAFCMDPPPFWFNADQVRALFGVAPTNIKVSTTSHYGLDQAFNRDSDRRRLMLILESDGQYVMPRYATQSIYTDRAGRDYLLITREHPIWWLPCSSYDLKEPVSRKDFGKSDWTSKIVHTYHKNELHLFEISGKSAFPKYGIPLDRLSAHLNEIKPSTSQMTCGREI